MTVNVNTECTVSFSVGETSCGFIRTAASIAAGFGDNSATPAAAYLDQHLSLVRSSKVKVSEKTQQLPSTTPLVLMIRLFSLQHSSTRLDSNQEVGKN